MKQKYLYLLASGVKATLPLKDIPRKFFELFHDPCEKSLASHPWRNIIYVQMMEGVKMRISWLLNHSFLPKGKNFQPKC